MNGYYKVKVKYRKGTDNGMTKEESKYYLFQAESCTEAEAEAAAYISVYYKEHEVLGITKTKYNEVFFYGTDSLCSLWYDAKVEFVVYNEATGVETRMKVLILVQAVDVKDAYDRIEAEMKGSLSEHRIISIGESSIIEVVAKERK